MKQQTKRELKMLSCRAICIAACLLIVISAENTFEIVRNVKLDVNFTSGHLVNSFDWFDCVSQCNRNAECRAVVVLAGQKCTLLNSSNFTVGGVNSNTAYVKLFSKYQESCGQLQCDVDLNLVCATGSNKCECPSQAIWSTIQNKCVGCPAGSYVKFNRCYMDLNVTDFHSVVNAACLALNATLVKIRNSEELSFYNVPYTNQLFCTSGVQLSPFQIYWHDGTQLSVNSSLFCDGQPSNFGPDPNVVNQPYILLYYFNSRMCINDKEASFPCTAFCEFDL